VNLKKEEKGKPLVPKVVLKKKLVLLHQKYEQIMGVRPLLRST
jgi:hypothetical protein